MLATTHRVLAPKELNSVTIGSFRDQTRDRMNPETTVLDVDMRETTFVDSSGLGGLISLNKNMASRGGIVRLVNPAANVQQLLELTRIHRIFEIVRE